MNIFSLSKLASISISLVSLNPGPPSSQKYFIYDIMTRTNPFPSIKTEVVLYTSNGKQSKGYIAYDENRKGKLPIVIPIAYANLALTNADVRG
jgi:hypothetical protein